MRMIDEKAIGAFARYLIEDEKATATQEKYLRDIERCGKWADGRPLDKALVLEYKQYLQTTYAPASVNSILSSLNNFFNVMGWHDLHLNKKFLLKENQMYKFILIAAFVLIYYNSCGLATTNMIRLTAGNTLPILSPQCRCGSCGTPIKPLMQQPIFSFIACRGRCRTCGIKLPKDALFLEITVLTGMIGITALFSFSLTGVLLSYAYYELVRVVFILIKGKRKDHFVGQYVIAVLMMIPHCAAALLASLIYHA